MKYIKISVETNNPNNLIESLEESYLFSEPQIIQSIILNGKDGFEIKNQSVIDLLFTKWELTCSLLENVQYDEIHTHCKQFCLANNITLLDYTIYTDNTDYVIKNQVDNIIELNNIIVFNNLNTLKNTPSDKHKIYVNASTAFGTGSHSTTLMCLKLIEEVVKNNNKIQNIIDVGTGSGILAITCNKLLPKSNIIATDIDELAIHTANNFFKDNNCNITTFVAKGLENLQINKQDLVIANILLEPLVLLKQDFYNILNPGGLLIVSGFLDSQTNEILSQYTGLFTLLTKLHDNGWMALLLKKI